jgi:hypothetical protein
VELLAIFLLFYVLEGRLRLPPDAVLFARARGGWRVRRRLDREGGDALLPLRPGALPVWAAPLPLACDADGARSTAPVGTLGILRAPRASAPALAWADLADARADGVRVRAHGTTLLHAVSRPHARALAALLAKLARATPAERPALVADAPAPDAIRARIDGAAGALRLATRSCDAYALVLFAAVPLAMIGLGESVALLGAMPVVAALHAVALVAVWRAHRTLLPDDVADRREALIAAALFPPSLLRLPQRTFVAAIGTAPPLAVAAALLDGDARVDFLRRALAAAEHGAGADADERARVLAIAAQLGVDAVALRRAPERADPLATAYCPRCFEGYRAGVERCADCALALVAWESR